MPTLKQLTCYLEWADSGAPLTEYEIKYGDGHVETYIAVPEEPTPFSIRLTSKGYIAPGLAMFVYMDGGYQCNRNRHNLRAPDGKSSRRHTEINFRVRQKEVMLTDGSIWGKPWRFEKVHTDSNKALELVNRAPYGGEYIGTIEVVVLRCDAPSNPQFSDVGQHSRALERGNACVIKPPSLSTLHGLDGHWDEPKVNGRPEQTWGFEMTGADTGVFRPVEEPESQVEDSVLSSGHSGELIHETSIELRNRGRDGVLVGPPTNVTSSSMQPARPLCQARSTSRSVTRSETSQKLKLDNGQNRVMEDVSDHSNHVVGVWADSPPRSKRAVSCQYQDVQGHGKNWTETLPESHPVLEPGWNVKAMQGNSKWTRPGLDRSPTEGQDTDKEKEMDTAKKDWYADNPTLELSEEPPQVRKTVEKLGNATHAMDTEEDVIVTWHERRCRHSISQPFPGAWPRSATPSPPQQEWAVSRPRFEEITIDHQAQTATPLHGPSAHALDFPTIQANTMEYPLPFDKPSASPDIKVPESVRDVDNTGSQSGLPLPPSHSPSPSTPRSPSYRISRSNTLRSISNLNKTGISPPRTKVDPADTESSVYTIPEELARRKNVTHQVSSGQSRAYTHKMVSPRYIDSHEDPYAVFIFKYRSKSFLEHTLNIELKDLDELGSRQSRVLPKDDISEQYIQTKSSKVETDVQSVRRNNSKTQEPKFSKIGDNSKETRGLGDDIGKATTQPFGSQIGQSFGTHDFANRISQPPKRQNQITNKAKITQKINSGGWSGDWTERISNDGDPISGRKMVTGDAAPIGSGTEDREWKHNPCGSMARLRAAEISRAGIDKDEDSTHGDRVHESSLGKDLDQDWGNNTTKDEMLTNSM